MKYSIAFFLFDVPRKSNRHSCLVTAMGSRTERANELFLSLVSHTMGGTPSLTKSLRWGLVATSRTGLVQSTVLPKTRVTTSLLTSLRNGLLEQGNQDIPHVVSVLGQSTFCGSRHAVRAREKLDRDKFIYKFIYCSKLSLRNQTTASFE